MEYGSKPRVAELIRSAEGGMKEHYMTLVKGLIDSGLDVIALCGFSFKERRELKKWGVKVVPFAVKGGLNPIRDVVAILRLERLLIKHRADIIHCHGFKAGLIGRIAALLARCDCIYTMHNFLPMDMGRRGRKIVAWIEKLLSRKTKNVIVVSKALEKEASQTLGIDKSKIRVIYNGVSFPYVLRPQQDMRAKWGIDREDKIVGTVARLIPSKGIDVLLDAVPLVLDKYPQTRFMIVGDGPAMSTLKSKAEALNCSKNIIFTGYSEYIWYYYEAFDVFVLPSLSEGLGISLLEAMIMGKPVIASSVGGIREIVKHELNGYLVTPGDSQELANAIIYFLSNPSQAQEYAQRGEKEIKNKFDLETMIRETSRIIYEAMER